MSRKLFVMTGGKYGYAYDFYRYVLREEGFDVYHLDFNTKLPRVRYLFRLLLKKYNTIISWEISRALLPVLAKSLPIFEKKTKDTKLATIYTRICGEAGDHGILWGKKGSWMHYAPMFESDAVIWNYNCYEELKTFFPRFPKEKFFVVHGGVDLDVYKPDPCKKEKQTIVTISNWFKPRKRLETLIEAMGFLPDWKLYVGGRFLQRDYEKYCHELAKKYEPKVRFLGFVEKPEWLQKASIFVMPSEYETGVESINEAMACGCKVLRVEGGGASEFLNDEETLPKGFDASFLAKRILEIAEKEELVKTNLEIVKRYSWKEVQKEMRKVLEVL